MSGRSRPEPASPTGVPATVPAATPADPADVPADIAARLVRALDRSPVAVVALIDADYHIRWLSHSARWISGADPAVRTGADAWERIHPDDAERLRHGLEQMRALGPVGTPAAPVVWPLRFRFRRFDERWVVLEAHVHNLLDDPAVNALLVEARPVAGGLDGVGHVVDLLVAEAPVTDVLAACAGLVPADLGSAAVVGLVGRNTIVGALDGSPARALSADDRWWRGACGSGARLTPAAFAGFPPDLVDRARAEGFRTAWVLPLTDRSSAEVMGCLAVWLPYELEPTVGTEASVQQPMRLAGLVIGEMRRRHALRREAVTDPLTGLGNRSALRRRLDTVPGPVTLALVDLDGFKPVNDTYGHAVGDAVLREVAERLRDAVRADDLVVRFGGDEFAVVFARETTPEGAGQLAERIVAAVGRPIVVEGADPLTVGASVGVATAGADKVVHEADAALYAAKREKAERRPG